jgi:hypothetical protein
VVTFLYAEKKKQLEISEAGNAHINKQITRIEHSTYLLHHENSYLSSVGTSRQRHKYSASLAACLWVTDIYWVVSLAW